MTVRERPVIVVGEVEHLATLSRTALADVIVTAAGTRQATELYGCLFVSYPGLTFTLIVGECSTVHLGSRDGRVLLMSAEGPVSIRSPWLRVLAVDLYAERARRAGPSARHVT
jgi:hypothetical protein